MRISLLLGWVLSLPLASHATAQPSYAVLEWQPLTQVTFLPGFWGGLCTPTATTPGGTSISLNVFAHNYLQFWNGFSYYPVTVKIEIATYGTYGWTQPPSAVMLRATLVSQLPPIPPAGSPPGPLGPFVFAYTAVSVSGWNITHPNTQNMRGCWQYTSGWTEARRDYASATFNRGFPRLLP